MEITNKEKAEWTYKMLQRRKQAREYKRKQIENDLTGISIRAKCKKSSKKKGQI